MRISDWSSDVCSSDLPNPALILLDEPFNALDLDLRRGMCEDVIALLRQTGTTTVLVTHDPAEAFAVSDRIAVMSAGSIMQCAEPDAIYWQPTSEPVARLTGSVIFLDGAVDDGHISTRDRKSTRLNSSH